MYFLKLLLFSLWLTSVLSAEEPWSISAKHPVTAELTRPRQVSPPKTTSLTQLLFKFYSHYLSPVDGPSCYYVPTCSAYSLQAVEQYGVWLGVLMTTDRLIRCHPQQKEHPVDPPRLY